MKKDDGLCELVYEYYESRILFGFYRYGEQLSSLAQICSSFRVSRNTVLAALARLEEQGYIATGERRTARVIYQGNEEVFRENQAKYFVPRKEGIVDFKCAGKLLFIPIWEAGLHELGQDTLHYTYKNLKMNQSDRIPVPVKLYNEVFRTLHNNLLLNLYWQCLRYLSFLYPRRKPDDSEGAVREFSWQDPAADLDRSFDNYYISLQNKVLAFVEAAGKEYHMEDAEQVPFTWTVFRRRPQMRYTLASMIIRDILWERCPVGSYLPSLPKMAEQYQVSVSTVRRTLAVLQSLGVIRTYMGIGSKVCLEAVDFAVLNAGDIQENLRLHGEGMEILSLTVRGVILYTLASSTEKKKEELLRQITELRGKTSSILCIDVLLNFIMEVCPSAIIRECYGKLRELVVWGYILSAALMSAGQLDSDFTDVMGQLEYDLQNGDLEGFAEKWQVFIEDRRNFFYEKIPFQT